MPATQRSHPTRRTLLLIPGAIAASTLAVLAVRKKPETSASPVDTKWLDALPVRSSGFPQHPLARGRLIHVFFDPLCPHCQTLWQASQPLGEMNFRWIPVAILAGSAPSAAALLTTSQPQELFARIKAQSKNAALLPPSQAALDQVQSNTDLLREAETTSVPLLLTRSGSEVILRIEGALSTQALAQRLAG